MARERTPAELEKMEANRRRQLAARDAEYWAPKRTLFRSYEDRIAGTDKPRADMAHCPRCGQGRLLGWEGDDPEDRQRAWEAFSAFHDRPYGGEHVSYWIPGTEPKENHMDEENKTKLDLSDRELLLDMLHRAGIPTLEIEAKGRETGFQLGGFKTPEGAAFLFAPDGSLHDVGVGPPDPTAPPRVKTAKA